MNSPLVRFGILIDDHAIDDEQIRKMLVFIDNHKMFYDWHSPFRGLILVLSKNSREDVSKTIFEYLGTGTRFLVFPMPKGGGRASFAKQTWEWLTQSSQAIENDLDE